MYSIFTLINITNRAVNHSIQDLVQLLHYAGKKLNWEGCQYTLGGGI